MTPKSSVRYTRPWWGKLGFAVATLFLAACGDDPALEPELCLFTTHEILKTVGVKKQVKTSSQNLRYDPRPDTDGEEVMAVSVEMDFTTVEGEPGKAYCGFVTRKGVTRLESMRFISPRTGDVSIKGEQLKALQLIVAREAWQRSMR